MPVEARVTRNAPIGADDGIEPGGHAPNKDASESNFVRE